MSIDLLVTFGLAFVGGLILNVMPCVLPVLTMKVYHLVEHGAGSDTLDPVARRNRDRLNRREALLYTLGVQLVFGAIIAVAIALKIAGHEYQWGMQFQNAKFVAAVCAVMVLLGLNALGVFEFTVSVDSGSHSGAIGSIFNGSVAAVMSTPCSAPFLGAAITYAVKVSTPIWATVVVFLLIGFGLAMPFLLVSYVPRLAKALPRPGHWMETFKQLMGFTLMGAGVWMYGVLLKQTDTDSAFWFLGFLLVLAVAVWGIQRFGGLEHDAPRRWFVRLVATGAIVGAAVPAFRFGQLVPDAQASTETLGQIEHVAVRDGRINWVPFTPGRVELHRKRQQPVFVDYTAEWCGNCKANEKAVLETDAVRAALEETHVLPMKADWTNEDELISDWLKNLGRSGIPAYAIYMPDGTVDILPEVITQGLVTERLRKAAEKYPMDKFLSLEQACLAKM